MNVVSASPREAGRIADRAQTGGRRLAQRERDWLVPLGRAGFAANGLVYIVVGWLAAQAALGNGGDVTDTGGALGHIIQAPFGRIVLGLVALGLAGYALWRLLQALLDTEHKGTDLSGTIQRIGFAVAAFTYAGLSLSAIAMATGRGGQPNEEQSTQDRVAWLMSQPFGPGLVILAGLVVIGVGLSQFVLAWRGTATRELESVHSRERELANVASRLGYTARGVAFGLIGVFLVLAGVQTSPDQAKGLSGALATLASEPFGPWLLAVVALGLIGYGVHMLIQARFRRMVID